LALHTHIYFFLQRKKNIKLWIIYSTTNN